MEQILEDEIDDSHCESSNHDILGNSLSTLPKPLMDEVRNESLDKETSSEAAKISDDADIGDTKSAAVPSERVESADTTPDSDSLNGETPLPKR